MTIIRWRANDYPIEVREDVRTIIEKFQTAPNDLLLLGGSRATLTMMDGEKTSVSRDQILELIDVDQPPPSDYTIPGYVAAVAGTDHAESAHDALSRAGRQAMDEGHTVLIVVTPEKTS